MISSSLSLVPIYARLRDTLSRIGAGWATRANQCAACSQRAAAWPAADGPVRRGEWAGCERGCRRVPDRFGIARRGQRWPRCPCPLVLCSNPLLHRTAGSRRSRGRPVRVVVGSAAPPTLAPTPSSSCFSPSRAPQGAGARSQVARYGFISDKKIRRVVSSRLTLDLPICPPEREE